MLYSPECLEAAFCELLLYGVLRSSQKFIASYASWLLATVTLPFDDYPHHLVLTLPSGKEHQEYPAYNRLQVYVDIAQISRLHHPEAVHNYASP